MSISLFNFNGVTYVGNTYLGRNSDPVVNDYRVAIVQTNRGTELVQVLSDHQVDGLPLAVKAPHTEVSPVSGEIAKPYRG